jgi:multiple sugar transport system permease protein
MWAIIKKNIWGYLFIVPLVTIFAVYYAGPILRALQLSFTNYHFLAPEGTKFVGLANYINAVKDKDVLMGFARAIWFTALFYLGSFIPPIAVAILLDRVRNRAVSSTYVTLLYLPAIVPATLIFALWRWMYIPSIGFVNWLIVDTLHLTSERPLWMGNTALDIPGIVFMEWWWGLGQMALFFLVGLSAIPREVYESARLDGASEWKITRYITLPLLKPTLTIWLIIKVAALGVIVEMMVFGGDVPPPSLTTWAVYAWRLSFKIGDMPMGYATAIGWIGAIAMSIITLILYKIFRSERT